MSHGQDPASTPGGLGHAGVSVLMSSADLIRTSEHLQVTLRADQVLKAIKDLARLVTDESRAAVKLTEDLLAGAERDTGLPSVTSGTLHGLDPHTCPKSFRVFGWGWGFRLSRIGQQHALRDLLDACQSACLSPVELHQVREALARAESTVRGIKAAAQRALDQHVSSGYGFLGCVPPHDTSPCGVLGLASPIVPGAPATWLAPDQEVMATAA